MAILEALSETHRRTLHCEAPAPDAEDTAIDVCAELFFAGMEIIAGGGGTKQPHAVKHDGAIHPSVWELQNVSLMELIARGIIHVYSRELFTRSGEQLSMMWSFHRLIENGEVSNRVYGERQT